MSTSDAECPCSLFYLCGPLSNACAAVNCIGQGTAAHPIKIYNGSSDEVVSTNLDPSLRQSSPALCNGIPGPFFNNTTALPGLIPVPPSTIHNAATGAAPAANIPFPEINELGIPPAYASAAAPCPFPAPVFPTPRQLPVIPPVSELALHLYIRYATGRAQVEDEHLRAFRSPSPILVSDIPERCEPFSTYFSSFFFCFYLDCLLTEKLFLTNIIIIIIFRYPG